MLTLATAGRWPSRLRQLPYKQKMRRFKPCPPHGPLAQWQSGGPLTRVRPGSDSLTAYVSVAGATG
jgi:hypothetical protein